MKHPAIKEHHLYGKAYAKGLCSKGRLCVVYVLRDYAYGRLLHANPRHIPFNRVGLTVTKTLGGAVQRSRIRRILRAGLTEAERYAPLCSGKLIVICARRAAAEEQVKSTEVARELIRHFKKLGLYQPQGQVHPPKTGETPTQGS